MTLRLYNTLSRAKEDFAPLDPKNVRMYVCGPTVYDFAHIGNARPVIVFDVLFRLLRQLYGAAHVTYVRNITDIDDKIIARAKATSGDKDLIKAIRDLTSETTQNYEDDVSKLRCLKPTNEPRATEFIPWMISLIETLISKQHAYEAKGHVLFDVASKPHYGKLSHRSVKEMLAGARVDVAPYKRGPMDFVLWKPSEDGVPGWNSPWGRGRPGWHIECSAMSWALLGETFDIHGGGLDLIFPHHENEIAQSEGAHHGHPPARYWVHNGFLSLEGEKMSKSLGNFVTIRELLRDWSGDVLRLNMLRTHYRQPLSWTFDGLRESEETLLAWQKFAVPMSIGSTDEPSYFPHRPLYPPFENAVCDDLNLPKAIKELHDLRNRNFHSDDNTVVAFSDALRFLGLLHDDVSDIFAKRRARVSITDFEINQKISARDTAKIARNFKEADRIRDELLRDGIQLKDNPDGTTSWEVKR